MVIGARREVASVVVHMSGAVPQADHDGQADGSERKSGVE